MLHYHKCHDCLTPFSSKERHIDECDCGGSVFYMGQVHGDQYVKTEDKASCDGRCTHASGPLCDCKCGGTNHGTGKVVQVVVSQGKIKATGLTEQDIERAEVFRKLRDYATNLYKTRFPEQGAAYDRDAFLARATAGIELQKINKLMIYQKRNERLIAFITTYK